MGEREIIQAVSRATNRSAALVHEEMKQGLNSLATVASIAPLAGLFGTIVGIGTSFVGCGGEKSACMAAVFDRLSLSIWPTAFGLLTGLTSLWCYRYLTGRLETVDREMETACIELVNRLSRHPGWTQPLSRSGGDRPMFGARSLAELAKDRVTWQRSMVLTGAALFGTWCVQVVRYFDQLPLTSATQAAFVWLLFTFGVSCLPAYPVWVKFLHRRPGGLVVLGSVLCLCWSVAELFSGMHLP